MNLNDFLNPKSNLATAKTGDIKAELNLRNIEQNIYPLYVFHEKLRPFIEAMVTEYQLPRDFIGNSLLSCYSTCIGSYYKVSTNGKDSRPLVLWTVNVGFSSGGKSLSNNLVFDPIKRMQAEMNRDWREATIDMTDSQIERMDLKTITFKDVLLPTLIKNVMPDNPKGVLKMSDEVIEWIYSMGAFNKNKDSTDEQFWLSSWDGLEYESIRSGKKRTYLHRVFIGLCGNITPNDLYKLFDKNRDTSGLMYRVLFAYPEKNDLPIVNPYFRIPEEFKKPHTDLCSALYNDMAVVNQYDPNKLCVLDNDSIGLYFDWKNKLIKEINNESDEKLKELKAGLMGKMTDYALRFAAILSLVDYVLDYKTNDKIKLFPAFHMIKVKHMQYGIDLANYYYQSGQRVYDKAKGSLSAPIEIVTLSVLFKQGKSLSQMAEIMFKEKSQATKSKLNRMLQKAVKDYPKLFNANSK